MVRINLLPIRSILRKRELKLFAFLAAGVVAATLVVMGVTYLGFSMKISGLKGQERNLQNKLKELKKKNQEINKLKDEITRLEKQVSTIEKLTKTRDTPAPFMKALALAIPGEVWVEDINKSGKTFSLSGAGLDNTVVVRFVQNLQDVRKDFSPKDWRVRQNKDPRFFSNVKLIQIIRQRARVRGGVAGVSFKIVGNVQ